MSDPPALPLVKHLPPGAWTALAWSAGAGFTFLVRARLPGEDEPAVTPGVLLYRWDGLATMAVATVLVVAGGALLHRRPLLAIAMMLAASASASVALSVGEIPLAQFLAVDVALCYIAATRPRRTGIVATAMALGVLVGYIATRLLAGWAVGTSAELTVALTAVIAWLIGSSLHQSRADAEQLRAQAAIQAVTDERLRIARELHDMVAHSIGIIALQAGAARRVIDTQPARAQHALGEVETASRETLAGLRRTLGALRQAEQAAPSLDVPGLVEVDRLAAATAATGVQVDVRWLGERRPLPPEIDRSAYRIVQESITNVVRHAGTGFCQVTIDYGHDDLSIEVVDGGRGHGTTIGIGYGLLGMRERVELLHGEFSAASRTEGGFRVAARLPLLAGVS